MKLLLIALVAIVSIAVAKIDVNFGEVTCDRLTVDSLSSIDSLDISSLRVSGPTTLGDSLSSGDTRVILKDSTATITLSDVRPFGIFWNYMDGISIESGGSMNLYLLSKQNNSNSIMWGSVDPDSIPSSGRFDQMLFALESSSYYSTFSLRDSVTKIWTADMRDSTFRFDGDYTVDVIGDLIAGTINADNGVSSTNFVIAVGDTITVEGGIITKLTH